MAFFSRKRTIPAAAADYGRRGFPVCPYGARLEKIDNGEIKVKKFPLTEHGCKDATANISQIEEWWEKHPDALILLRLGAESGVIAIDIDKHEDVEKWVRHCKDKLGFDPCDTAWERTRRGAHFLFNGEGVRIKSCENKIFPGVAVLAEKHGLIISPSKYIINEQEYAYVAANEEDLLPIPRELFAEIERLGLVAKKDEPAAPAPPPKKSPTEEGRAYLKKVADELKSKKDFRNNELNKIAYKVAGVAAAGEIDAEEAKKALADAAAAAGLEPGEIAKTLRSGWEAGSKFPVTTRELREKYGIAIATRPDVDDDEEPKTIAEFPWGHLPPGVEDIIKLVSEVKNTDPWLAFGAIIAGVAAIVGANHGMYYEDNFTPAVNWIVVIADSGAKKSGVTRKIWHPIAEWQKRFTVDYVNELNVYNEKVDAWREKKKKGDAGPEPRKPRRKVLFTEDVTLEKLVSIFADNPGGVAWKSDEFAAWKAGIGKYRKNGDGGDQARLLSMFEGESSSVDRITRDLEIADKCWLSVYGTVQPRILPKLIDESESYSGFLQRFLFIRGDMMPPIKPSDKKSQNEIMRLQREIQDKINDLWWPMLKWPRIAPQEMLHDPSDPGAEYAELRPASLADLSDDAKRLLDEVYFSWQDEAYTKDAVKRAIVNRQCECCSRLIFALHCLKSADDGRNDGPAPQVNAQTVADGVAIFNKLREHADIVWRSFKFEEEEDKKELFENADFHVLKQVAGALKLDPDDCRIEDDHMVGFFNRDARSIKSNKATARRLKKLGFGDFRNKDGRGWKTSLHKFADLLLITPKKVADAVPREIVERARAIVISQQNLAKELKKLLPEP